MNAGMTNLLGKRHFFLSDKDNYILRHGLDEPFYMQLFCQKWLVQRMYNKYNMYLTAQSIKNVQYYIFGNYESRGFICI